jgi:hypothetical protein
MWAGLAIADTTGVTAGFFASDMAEILIPEFT